MPMELKEGTGKEKVKTSHIRAHFHLHLESEIEQPVFYVVQSIKPTADCVAIDFSIYSF